MLNFKHGMEIAALFFWVAMSVVIGIAGQSRTIGFLGAFFSSLLLSPICGLILTGFSKNKKDMEFMRRVLNQLEKNPINNDDI